MINKVLIVRFSKRGWKIKKNYKLAHRTLTKLKIASEGRNKRATDKQRLPAHPCAEKKEVWRFETAKEEKDPKDWKFNFLELKMERRIEKEMEA